MRRLLLALFVSLAVSVFALARSSPSLPPATHMQGRSTAPEGGYYALVIGNNNYASLPKLKTAEADAREVASLLKEFYGFETRLLLNATRQQIVTALFSYRQTLGPDANLLVYYAGHGINDTQAEKSYWLPVDATREDDSNWISADDITTRIRAIPARHVLVISDSCYSGTLTRGLGEALPPPNEREQFIQRMMAGRSRTLMASGGDEPVADSGSGGHSVFAAALLRGLRDMDKGKFTAAELFRNYVQEPVAGRAQQTPEYNPLRNSGHEAGDFVFVKIKTDGKNVEVTLKAPTPAPAAAVDPAAIELSFWESIKASTDAEDFKAYLDSYPSGRFAALARNNIRRLEAAKSATPPTGKTPTDSLRGVNAATENAPRPGSPRVPAAEQFETRCGWYSNPTPANASLHDRDGEWIIGVQGGHQAAGDRPSFKPGEWVETSGHHGYGCACLRVRADRETHRVIEIESARARPLTVCRRDRSLTKWGFR